MIDVSTIPPSHAAIALLIERSGTEGRRVKELVNESPLSKGSICRILADLLDWGYCEKICGDVPRYYPPSISAVRPMVSHVRPSVSSVSEEIHTIHTRLDPPHTDPSEQEVDFSMFPDATRRLLIELWDARDRTIDKEDIRQDVIGDDDVGDGAVHMVVTRARSDMKKYGFPYEIQYVRERKRYTLIPKGSP